MALKTAPLLTSPRGGINITLVAILFLPSGRLGGGCFYFFSEHSGQSPLMT